MTTVLTSAPTLPPVAPSAGATAPVTRPDGASTFANLLALLDPAAATGPAAPDPDAPKADAPRSDAPETGTPTDAPADAATTPPAAEALAAAVALPAMLVAAQVPPPAPPPASPPAPTPSAPPAGPASPTPVTAAPTRRAPITRMDAAASHPQPATPESPPTPPPAVAFPAVTIPAAPAASVAPAVPVMPAMPASYATTVPGVPQPALSGALARLRHGVDGVHEIEVALHPADLGSVQVRVTISHGTLDVTVACADQSARDAVSAALPSLRHELAGLQVDLTSARPTVPVHGAVTTSPSDRPAGGGSDQHRSDPHADPHDPAGQPDQNRRGRHRPDDDFDRWM